MEEKELNVQKVHLSMIAGNHVKNDLKQIKAIFVSSKRWKTLIILISNFNPI